MKPQNTTDTRNPCFIHVSCNEASLGIITSFHWCYITHGYAALSMNIDTAKEMHFPPLIGVGLLRWGVPGCCVSRECFNTVQVYEKKKRNNIYVQWYWLYFGFIYCNACVVIVTSNWNNCTIMWMCRTAICESFQKTARHAWNKMTLL